MIENARREKAGAILKILSETYPEAECGLKYETPFQLLVATILSAQCTDTRVNMVTGRLFGRCGDPATLLALGREGLEREIRECGLFREKAGNIHDTCRLLLERHGGDVPASLEELVSLPGVGRKTANVVLSNAFDIPAIAVDTHVHRVARRLGLVDETATPHKAEMQLMELIPREMWSRSHHRLIQHGRSLCTARSPRCPECPFRAYCSYGTNSIKETNLDLKNQGDEQLWKKRKLKLTWKISGTTSAEN